jgi:hypothetical protein
MYEQPQLGGFMMPVSTEVRAGEVQSVELAVEGPDGC